MFIFAVYKKQFCPIISSKAMKNANISRYFFSFQNIKYLIKGFQSLQVQTEQIEFVCYLTQKRFGGRGSVWSLPSVVFPRRFSPSILTIFMDLTDFSTFPCYKETNDVSILQIMSAFFYFQLFLNNCIKLYLYHIKLVLLEIWKEGGQLPPEKKTTVKKPSLIRVNNPKRTVL